jgi:hypothetical protein
MRRRLVHSVLSVFLIAAACGGSEEHAASADAGTPAADAAQTSADAGRTGGASDAGPSDAGSGADSSGRFLCPDTSSLALSLVVYDADNRALLSAGGTSDVVRSFTGSVTEQGLGRVPSEAAQAARNWGIDADRSSWARLVSTSGASWVVMVSTGPVGLGLAQGMSVSATYKHQFSDFSPAISSLELRTGSELAYYFGQSSAPAELDLPPELSASLGAELCSVPGDCGDYALHALDVEANGESATLASQETKLVGGFDVQHGRSAVQTRSGGCADWFVSDTTLQAVRHAR